MRVMADIWEPTCDITLGAPCWRTAKQRVCDGLTTGCTLADGVCDAAAGAGKGSYEAGKLGFAIQLFVCGK